MHLACQQGLEDGVLCASDVSDVNASFVADPFMIRHNDRWSMFFEVFDQRRRRGAIGLAQSANLLKWQYNQIVIEEPFHLSYPNVFQANGDYFMVVETLGRDCISLYHATSFPIDWTFVRALVPGKYADPTIVWHDDRWYLFACATPYEHDTLCLFSAQDLEGDWTEHPASPLIISDARRARPAGRIVRSNGRLFRYAQDCVAAYGANVWAFSIGTLNENEYSEQEALPAPLFSAGAERWNQGGLHHVDAHRISPGTWVACVDGWISVEDRD